MLKAVRQVFTYGLEAEPDTCRANPAGDVRYLKTSSEGTHTWTIDEVHQDEAAHPIGTMARMELSVLAFTGQRRSDAVQFGRQRETKDGASLAFTQFKGRKRKPVKLLIPILPELRAVIDKTPRKGLTYIETEFNRRSPPTDSATDSASGATMPVCPIAPPMACARQVRPSRQRTARPSVS